MGPTRNTTFNTNVGNISSEPNRLRLQDPSIHKGMVEPEDSGTGSGSGTSFAALRSEELVAIQGSGHDVCDPPVAQGDVGSVSSHLISY